MITAWLPRYIGDSSDGAGERELHYLITYVCRQTSTNPTSRFTLVKRLTTTAIVTLQSLATVLLEQVLKYLLVAEFVLLSSP